MLKNKKMLLVLALPVLLFAGFTMTKHKTVPKMKIEGTIYVMPKDFLLNLSDGRYARLTVALELAPGQSDGASSAAAASSGSGESASAGTLPEEPVVREIVTNAVTNASGEDLIGAAGRRAIKHQILQSITQETDLKVQAVLFPDLTVQ